MVVKLISYDPDPEVKICDLMKICYPEIKSDELNKNEIKRLIRRLIRLKDMTLRSVHVLVEFNCPIFVYNDMCRHLREIRFHNISFNLSDLSFEIPDKFNDKQTGQMTCLYKKVKSIIKSMTEGEIPNEDIIHILPMASMVTFYAHLDFLEIFEIISRIQRFNVHEKTTQITDEIFALVHEQFPCFFTKQNLEIFMANKEN
jgi:signal recognition particle GTPase